MHNILDEYEFIESDTLDTFEDFIAQKRKSSKKIMQYFPSQPELLLNGFTEISWGVGQLGAIEKNIPFFFAAAEKYNYTPSPEHLKNIAIVNFNFLRNYFRNHVLLKAFINNNNNIQYIADIITTHISPLFLLLQKIWFTSEILQNNLETSQNAYELVFTIEYFFKEVSKFLWIPDAVLQYEEKNVENIWREFSCLQNPEMKIHTSTLTEILKETEKIEEYIETFFLYGSVANNSATKNSDMLDAILIISDKVLENRQIFEKVLSCIIAANQKLMYSKIASKHPFHYMFVRDINSMSPYHKKTFLATFKCIQGKKVAKILNHYDPPYDNYYNKFKLINLFQAVRNQTAHLIYSHLTESQKKEFEYESSKFFKDILPMGIAHACNNELDLKKAFSEIETLIVNY